MGTGELVPYRDTQLVLPGIVKASPAGLEFSPDITEAEWELVGEVLDRIEVGVRWWRGDWANCGESKWGRTYADLEERTGRSYSTLSKDAYVSARFEFCRRRQNLSFGHHHEVAPLDPGDQDKWLDTAEANEWTRAQLREARKAFGVELPEVDDEQPTVTQLAHRFEGLDDTARLARLGINIQPYDVWNFPGCHGLMGDQHPGRIPGELLCHVIYFYTKPGDLVLDPMAGSGTTLDACLLMGRAARGYDIDHRHYREDIETHDMADGWPDAANKADLVFWDPPYYKKMDGGAAGHGGTDGYIDGSVSRLSHDEYIAFFAGAFAGLRKIIKPGARFAFLMSDWDGEGAKHPDDERPIWLWDYADLLRNAGWTIKRHIQVPLSTQQVHPDIVNKFRASRRLARLERYLLIAQA